MSRKGGYKIINFNDIDLKTGVATKIDGIYDAIENSYRKPLLFTGLVLNGVEKTDAYVTLNVNSGNYETTLYGVKFTITAEDNVTIAKA